MPRKEALAKGNPFSLNDVESVACTEICTSVGFYIRGEDRRDIDVLG